MMLSVLAASAQLPFDLVNMQLHTVRNAEARGAVCNDGSPATYYFRDCPRPADECAGFTTDWFVVFADGDSSDACFDKDTCMAREAGKMSSAGLNATLLSPAGLFSYSGEENPNFYGYRTVLVPYCSSDMWLGNASAIDLHFRGRAIAAAVMEDLASITFSPVSVPTVYGPGPNQTRLDKADSLTIVGNAGVMHQLGALAALVPSRPAKQLKAICDGCVLPAVKPLVSVAERPCTDALDCPPAAVLQQGLALWELTTSWRELQADALLPAIQLQLLVQQPRVRGASLECGGTPSIFFSSPTIPTSHAFTFAATPPLLLSPVRCDPAATEPCVAGIRLGGRSGLHRPLWRGRADGAAQSASWGSFRLRGSVQSRRTQLPAERQRLLLSTGELHATRQQPHVAGASGSHDLHVPERSRVRAHLRG